MNARAVGLDLDPIHPVIAVMPREGALAGIPESCRVDFPVALIPSPLRGGPATIDFRWPSRPEGTGLSHEDLEELAKARIPLAYVWELLFSKHPPRLCFAGGSASDRGTQVTEAIGVAAAQFLLAATDTEGTGAELSAFVVPNAIEEDEQEEILRAVRRGLRDGGARNSRIELVWRPIAAALRWIECFEPVLVVDRRYVDKSAGRLLHLHLGLDAFEATLLDIVPHEEDGKNWLLAGRTTPTSEDLLLQVPSCTMETLAQHLPGVEQAHDLIRRRMAWNALWVSPLLQEMITPGRFSPGTEPGMPPWMPATYVDVSKAELMRRLQQPADVSRRWFEPLRHSIRKGAHTSFEAWLRHVRSMLRPPILGAVITGPFACMSPKDGRSVGVNIVNGLAIPRDRVLQEGMDEGGILAQGAKTYAARRLRDEPTYLDTLPKVSIIALKLGEPFWEDLLKAESLWVLGGRTWRSTPRNVKFQIDRGQRDLDLVVHREGAETCKKVAIQFEYPTDAACPVSLSIEMEPGQGKPRIEVVPQDKRLFRGRALYLDWETASDTGRSPDDELELVERFCPPHEPRLSSRNRWMERRFQKLHIPEGNGVRALLLNYLIKPHEWSVDGFKSLSFFNQCLRETRVDAAGRIASAVSSDGQVTGSPGDQALLERFVESVSQQLSSSHTSIQRECLRILGSVSAHSSRLVSFLRTRLTSRRMGAFQVNRWAFVYACGNCLRVREDIDSYFAYFDDVSPDYADAEALAGILMYRENALEFVENSRLESWLSKILQLLGPTPVGLRAQLRFSRAALVIGYLLRRRCFDSTFLAPGTDTHRKVKSAVQRVYREPQAIDTTGVKKTIDALKRVLDYIDKKGRGRLTALMLDDE